MVILYTLPGLDNADTFYTDANGRQFIKRVKNERTQFEFTEGDAAEEPVAANYYPVTNCEDNFERRNGTKMYWSSLSTSFKASTSRHNRSIPSCQ